MIFGLMQIKKLAEQNIVTEETYTNLLKYFDNYSYEEDSFSEEDRKLIKAENKKGNFDIFSDKDLLNAKRDGIISADEFTNILNTLRNEQNQTGNQLTNLKELIKENDSTHCFETIPLSKIIVLSFLSCGLYDIILSFNYWKILKEKFGYNVSPLWRGLFEIFTNFKLFPFFSKYFEIFNIKFTAIWFAILYILCRSHIRLIVNNHTFDIYGIHINLPYIKINLSGGLFILNQNLNITITEAGSDYIIYIKALIFGIICIVFALNLGGALVFAVIQNKINRINKQYYPEAPKNEWNVTNIIWAVVLAILLVGNLIHFIEHL